MNNPYAALRADLGLAPTLENKSGDGSRVVAPEAVKDDVRRVGG